MTRAIIRKQNPIVSRLAEVGRCYKGSPKGTSSKPRYQGGDDYASHYIRFEPEARLKLHPSSSGEHANLYEELKAAWETMTTQGHIKIRFPHTTIEENFPYSNKVIKSIGGVEKTLRECDGQTCTKWAETGKHPTKPGETIPIIKRGAVPCAATEGKECPMGCQAKGMLKFMVPDLYPGGVILFPLNSPVDISAIAGYLEPYRQYDLSAIPFNLFRREDIVNYEEKGEQKQKRNWGLHLGIDPTITRLMMESRSRNFINQLEGRPTHSLPQRSASTSALPPAEAPNFRGSDDGFNFVSRVTAGIQRGSREEVNAAIEDARELIYSGLYEQRSGHAFIDGEEKRALDALRNMPGRAMIVEDSPEINPAQEQVKSFQTRTRQTNKQLLAMAKELNLPTHSSEYTVADADKLCDLMLIKYAQSQGLDGSSAASLVQSSKGKLKNGSTDWMESFDRVATRIDELNTAEDAPAVQGEIVEDA